MSCSYLIYLYAHGETSQKVRTINTRGWVRLEIQHLNMIFPQCKIHTTNIFTKTVLRLI
jgi:hypothetical protein